MHDYQMLPNCTISDDNHEEKVMHGHVHYHQMILHRFAIIYENSFFGLNKQKSFAQT